MRCRLFFISLTLMISLAAIQTSGAQTYLQCDVNSCPPGYSAFPQANGSCMCVADEAPEPCDSAACGPGYKAVLQSNGSCMCIASEAPQPCDSATCGPGYKAVLQSNGSCMCVAADCTNIEGCPEPPKAVEDCASIEGCNPPPIIKP